MKSGAPGVIRTPDLLVSASGGLYSAEPSMEARIVFSSSRSWPVLKKRSLRTASGRISNFS